MKNIFFPILFALLIQPLFSKPSAIDYYYGIDVEKDYKKALELFEGSTDSTALVYIMLIYLNGDGVERNPQKALEVWKKAIGTRRPNATDQNLKGHIDQRLSHPEIDYPRLEYWKVAMTTFDMVNSGAIKLKIDAYSNRMEIKSIEDTLNEEQLEIFRKIIYWQKEIQDKDSYSAYNENFFGSMRGIMGNGMRRYIQERHQNTIREWLIKKNYPDWNKDDFLASDRELNAAYQKERERTKNMFEIYIQGEEDPKMIQDYRLLRLGILDDLKKSQLAWIQYRDLWVQLMLSINSTNKMNLQDLEFSIKTQLSRERSEEIIAKKSY